MWQAASPAMASRASTPNAVPGTTMDSRQPITLIAFSFSENLWTLPTVADWL
jgi:hypothetical protein